MTLACALACVALAAATSVGQWPSNAAVAPEVAGHPPKLMQAVGPAPAFCKGQTWPNIDARCLNRTEAKVVDAPASVTPAPTAAPAAPPPAEDAEANMPQVSPPSDVAGTEPPAAGPDSSTVGMSEADVWPAEPTPRPSARSSRRSSGWNLPTGRSSW